MYNERIEGLISAALADGELTEKEKQILFKRAEEQGIDLNEFEMVLNARLFEMKKTMQQTQPNKEASPKSNKFGDIKKCPACGAIIQNFQTKCNECGHEFRDISAVTSAQKLFDLLQAAEMRKSEHITAHNQEKARRLEELSKRHNSDSSITKILGGSKRKETQDEEREDLIRELNNNLSIIEKSAEQEKLAIIKNFPVPNTGEDLIELLAMTTSNAYDNDGVIGLEEEAWLQKTDQIYQKVIVCSANDKTLLKKATHMVASLMRRLPDQADYKNFTKIPTEMKTILEEELRVERKHKQEKNKQLIISLLKIYGSIAGIAILVGIIFALFEESVAMIFFIIACISIVLGYKAWKKKKDDNLF